MAIADSNSHVLQAAAEGKSDGTNKPIILVFDAVNYRPGQTEKELKAAGFVIQQHLQKNFDDYKELLLLPNALKHEEADNGDKILIFLVQGKNTLMTDAAGDSDNNGTNAARVITDSATIRKIFPGTVLEDYLIYPKEAHDYLQQLKPPIFQALSQICDNFGTDEQEMDPAASLANCLLRLNSISY